MLAPVERVNNPMAHRRLRARRRRRMTLTPGFLVSPDVRALAKARRFEQRPFTAEEQAYVSAAIAAAARHGRPMQRDACFASAQAVLRYGDPDRRFEYCEGLLVWAG